jgi:DNA-directed RNA polymerase subunit F
MEKEKANDLTPERVKQILKKKGTEVDLEEAQVILEFVKKIAHIAVNQYLRGKL